MIDDDGGENMDCRDKGDNGQQVDVSFLLPLPIKRATDVLKLLSDMICTQMM